MKTGWKYLDRALDMLGLALFIGIVGYALVWSALQWL